MPRNSRPSTGKRAKSRPHQTNSGTDTPCITANSREFQLYLLERHLCPLCQASQQRQRPVSMSNLMGVEHAIEPTRSVCVYGSGRRTSAWVKFSPGTQLLHHTIQASRSSRPSVPEDDHSHGESGVCDNVPAEAWINAGGGRVGPAGCSSLPTLRTCDRPGEPSALSLILYSLYRIKETGVKGQQPRTPFCLSPARALQSRPTLESVLPAPRQAASGGTEPLGLLRSA